MQWHYFWYLYAMKPSTWCFLMTPMINMRIRKRMTQKKKSQLNDKISIKKFWPFQKWVQLIKQTMYKASIFIFFGSRLNNPDLWWRMQCISTSGLNWIKISLRIVVRYVEVKVLCSLIILTWLIWFWFTLSYKHCDWNTTRKKPFISSPAYWYLYQDKRKGLSCILFLRYFTRSATWE